jgi:hypothetical protein
LIDHGRTGGCRGCNRRRDHVCCGETWRIDQRRVLAHQAAGRPDDFDQQFDERIVHPARRGCTNDQRAVPALLDRQTHRSDEGGVLEVRAPIGVGIRDADLHRRQLVLGRAELDLGVQRLAERGEHGHAPQARGICQGGEEHRNRERAGGEPRTRNTG